MTAVTLRTFLNYRGAMFHRLTRNVDVRGKTMLNLTFLAKELYVIPPVYKHTQVIRPLCCCISASRGLKTHHTIQSSWTRSYSAKANSAPSELIYQGPLTTMVKVVKFFSLSTTIISACIIPYLLTYGQPGAMTSIGISFASVMIATPVLLHWLSRSYVTRLYYDEDKEAYVAKTVTFILREATHNFSKRDVDVPSMANLFTTFQANGRPFLVDPRGFINPNHFSQLMGYDQMDREDIEKILKKMKEDED